MVKAIRLMVALDVPPLTASFDDLVCSGNEGAADRV
jgi:hypothetical protein